MKIFRSAMCSALPALMLAACQSAAGGDSFLQAMGKGALAGIQEGLTGEEQQNPYLTENAAPAEPSTHQNASTQPDVDALAGMYGRKHADLIVQGHIDVGMDEDEVVLAWGEPSAKKPNGRNREVWDYGDDKVVFTKGKVLAVTH
jgi:hypothetical protein